MYRYFITFSPLTDADRAQLNKSYTIVSDKNLKTPAGFVKLIMDKSPLDVSIWHEWAAYKYLRDNIKAEQLTPPELQYIEVNYQKVVEPMYKRNYTAAPIKLPIPLGDDYAQNHNITELNVAYEVIKQKYAGIATVVEPACHTPVLWNYNCFNLQYDVFCQLVDFVVDVTTEVMRQTSVADVHELSLRLCTIYFTFIAQNNRGALWTSDIKEGV